MVLYRRYASCETTSAGIEVTWHGEDRATLRFSKFSYLTNCWDLVFEVKYENPNSEFCFDDFKIENETVQEEPHIDFQYNFASYYLTRSLIVKLHNHTKQTLTRSSYFLKHGVWISSILPPEKIPPNSTITWGCRNSVFMRGTEGHLHYQLVSNNAFKFSWNNPYIHGVYAFNHCEPKNYGINIISHKPGNMAELELELISLNSTESIAPTSTPIPAVTSPTPIMLFERQTIGKMIDKTELFRAVRQEIMIQKSHQFEKLKNRIALVIENFIFMKLN